MEERSKKVTDEIEKEEKPEPKETIKDRAEMFVKYKKFIGMERVIGIDSFVFGARDFKEAALNLIKSRLAEIMFAAGIPDGELMAAEYERIAEETMKDADKSREMRVLIFGAVEDILNDLEVFGEAEKSLIIKPGDMN